jgi:hypothetical protein
MVLKQAEILHQQETGDRPKMARNGKMEKLRGNEWEVKFSLFM